MVKIVRLHQKDIESLIELSLLVDSTCLETASYSEWASWLNLGMKIWGIKDKDKLVAIGSLSYYDIPGKPMNTEDFQVAVLTNGQVHPNYRGRGYHKILIFIRIVSALWTGIHRIQSLTRPSNSVCIKNLEKMHFVNQGQYDDNDPVCIFEYQNSLMINFFQVINLKWF